MQNKETSVKITTEKFFLILRITRDCLVDLTAIYLKTWVNNFLRKYRLPKLSQKTDQFPQKK